MTIDTNDLLNSILQSLERIDYIHPEEIPNIDLYMDQVTTFMETQLRSTKRYEQDKILTKTMINNYAKNHLLPPPVKKKYSKDHMLMLVFIYYFKNVLSFADIEEIFRPITSRHFSGRPSDVKLEDIYEEVFTLAAGQMDRLREDLMQKYDKAQGTFGDSGLDGEEQEYLRLFALICELSFDVYLKKQMIELLADQLRSESPDRDRKKK